MDDLYKLARVKREADDSAMRYLRIGEVAARLVWVIVGGIIIIVLWGARLEWKTNANTGNISKLWEHDFPKVPMKDE